MIDSRKYLDKLRRIDERILSYSEAKKEHEALVYKCTAGQITDMPRSSNHLSKEDVIIEKIMFDDQVNKSIVQLTKFKEEAIRKIDQMDNNCYAVILTERYVNNKSLKVIAKILNMSKSHTDKLHGYALKEFEQYIKDDTL